MKSSLRLGKVMGIEIGIHYSWLIIFVIVTWSLAIGFFPVLYPSWPVATYWIVSAMASLLLFGSVLIHELSHSFVALGMGMKVSSITLFIFGGVSNLTGEPKKPWTEFAMSIAGPLASVVLGVVFAVLWLALRGVNQQLTGIFLYLATVNILLAIFNMIPGFPLDGGRVFRSIVWWLTGSFRRATRIATLVGQGVAYLMIFGGILLIFTGNILGGIWIAIIGWFLNTAAVASYRQSVIEQELHGVMVRQIMNPHPITVEPDVTLKRLVDDFILPRNVRALPVLEEGHLVGMVTLDDVKRIPIERWDSTEVRSVMRSRDHLLTVNPAENLDTVLRDFAEEDLNQLPVVEDGRLVGVVTRNNLIHYVQVKKELGARP